MADGIFNKTQIRLKIITQGFKLFYLVFFRWLKTNWKSEFGVKKSKWRMWYGAQHLRDEGD